MTPSDNDWCTHHTHTHTFKVCIQHIGDGRDHDLAPLSPHTPHATTEHHVENVHRRAEASPAAPAASLLDGLLSSLVIDLPLLSVGQDLVGLKQ